MKETTFENAKVGDRCYSSLFKSINAEDRTNATICAIYDKSKLFQLSVEPDVAGFLGSFTFTLKGNYHSGDAAGQVLFWENPIKEIPFRPKRKVIQKGYMGIKLEAWITESLIACTTNIYRSEKDIPNSFYHDKILPFEFEIEE